MPVEIICLRSGLKFEAPNRRTKVHPQISRYTSHKDTGVRYPAISVIERGKQEGWDSIEKFEAEIQKALNPVPQLRTEYDFEGALVAEIIGASEQYRFERSFLREVESIGRFKRFALQAVGDGIYECCYKAASLNESHYYYRVQKGKLTELNLASLK